MAEFNENHRRRVLSTFRYLDQLLDESEHIMAAARSRSAFPRYVPDTTPVQRKVLSDHISRFRDTLLAALPTLDLAPGKPEISMLRALRVQLITAEIALEELTGSAMRGYGPLSAASADTLDGVAAQLRGRLQAIARFLDEPPDQDLHARAARLSATTDEVRLLRELERVVTAHGLVELRPGLAMVIEQMESRRFEIAVFGRVSAGKSSLLNHLLRYDALPVGVTPITAVPIRVTFGREERVIVNFAEREPMVVPLSGLADVATEQRNPGNRAHVTQVTVELPAPRLASGVTFVDTPGLGSLAVGAEDTLAYLPRCDLGLVLVDAASSPGPDELTVVRALYQAGATAAVLLSKADLLSPAERDQVVRHVQGLLASECGVDVPVSPVSVVGAAAALADEWFDTVLQPLFRRQGEMAAVALRRKVGALRDAAIASLRHRMERRPESAPPAAADAREAAGGLAHAATLLEAANTRCATLAAGLEGAAEQAIAAAATAAAAGRRSRAERQQAADEALGEGVARQAETVAGGIAAALAQLRTELADALGEAARVVPGYAAADLPRISGLPVIDPSVLAGRLVLTRSLLGGLGTGGRRRAIAAQMRSQLFPAVRQALDSYRQRLIAWSRSIIAEQRRSFDAQAEVVRLRLPVSAGAAAAPTGEKLAAMERDLALLAGWEREAETAAQSNATSAGARADGGAAEP
jgi:GTP-binding protein EngB required for normal cell division